MKEDNSVLLIIIFKYLDRFNFFTTKANETRDVDEQIFNKYDAFHEYWGIELEHEIDKFFMNAIKEYPEFDQNDKDKMEAYSWELLDGIVNGKYSYEELNSALENHTFLDLIGQSLI